MKTESANNLFFEIGSSQLIKHGEELCGDSVITRNSPEGAVIIMSDGLGSGVKANILSTLTSTILSVMIQNDVGMTDILETLLATLPTCSYRQLAYSTFTYAQFMPSGRMHVANYDNPHMILIRDDKIVNVSGNEHIILDKKINEATISLKPGDTCIFLSDGEIHAGMNGMCNLGFGWTQVAEFAARLASKAMTAKEIAYELTNVAWQLYCQQPGDDTTAVVVRVREKHNLTMMVGAPENPEDDVTIVEQLMAPPGRKIVCGGTTSNIVSRELGCEVTVDFSSIRDDIPPVGTMPGIHLCTEGIITISNALKLLKEHPSYKRLEIFNDGVSRLVHELMQADDITILIGQAMNQAHKSTNLPTEFGLKTQIMEKIAGMLTAEGKHVRINYF